MAHNTQVKAEPRAARHAPVGRVRRRASVARLDADVEHEAHRTLLNWLGCAIGAARHAAAEAALAAVRELEPAPQATVLGRAERVDMASAALVNGITSHTFDFDDTHLRRSSIPPGRSPRPRWRWPSTRRERAAT